MTWTQGQDELLTTLWQDRSKTISQLEPLLGMGEARIRRRVHHLKLPMRGRAQSSWGRQLERRLLQLRAEGKSFSEVGAALGITRNAAIGKFNRLTGGGQRKPAAPIPAKQREPSVFAAKARHFLAWRTAWMIQCDAHERRARSVRQAR